jgi:hypothetical protein
MHGAKYYKDFNPKGIFKVATKLSFGVKEECHALAVHPDSFQFAFH